MITNIIIIIIFVIIVIIVVIVNPYCLILCSDDFGANLLDIEAHHRMQACQPVPMHHHPHNVEARPGNPTGLEFRIRFIDSIPRILNLFWMFYGDGFIVKLKTDGELTYANLIYFWLI